MSVTSGFFNSLNGDRRYTAEQFSELMDGLINDGVFANIGSAFAVNAATGNGITIGIGRAWFNGTWLYNDAVLPMNVRAAEALVDRIDALVIEINRSDAVRAGNIMFVYGEPSSTPVRPTLTNTDEIHQYPLAYIYRSAGATSVSQADIENMVGTSACPFVTGILEVVDVDQLLTQWNTQFGNWFDNLQITLSGDVAANLANQILELQSQFDTLAKEKAVYSVLFDSSGEAIRDNNNGEIMGKTVVGGDGNSTVNIEGDTYQIGDTLTTARTDLGEEWFLCNDETISALAYPRLKEVLPTTIDGPWTTYEFGDTRIDTILDYQYIDGYHHIIGIKISYPYSNYPRCYRSTLATLRSRSLSDGPWLYEELWHYENTSNYSYNQFGYRTRVFDSFKVVNGHYFITGQYRDVAGTSSSGDDEDEMMVAYKNGIDGTWTTSTQEAYFGNDDFSAFNLVYENGYYVSVSENILYNSTDGYYFMVYYSTDLGSASPFTTYKAIVNPSPSSGYAEAGPEVAGIHYGNGQWVVIYNVGFAYSSDITNQSGWAFYTESWYYTNGQNYNDICWRRLHGFYEGRFLYSQLVRTSSSGARTFYIGSFSSINSSGLVDSERVTPSANGNEYDAERCKRFVDFKYIPGIGYYLILTSNLYRSATSKPGDFVLDTSTVLTDTTSEIYSHGDYTIGVRGLVAWEDKIVYSLVWRGTGYSNDSDSYDDGIAWTTSLFGDLTKVKSKYFSNGGRLLVLDGITDRISTYENQSYDATHYTSSGQVTTDTGEASYTQYSGKPPIFYFQDDTAIRLPEISLSDKTYTYIKAQE